MSKIALVPMAAKPYHAGHHALLKKAAAENEIVNLYISITDRARPNEFIIRGKDMTRVWQNYLEPILPSNVTPIYVKNPVREVYKELELAENSNVNEDIYMVYSDPQDTASNYPESYRQKYFPQLYNSGHVQFAAECDEPGCTRGVGTPDISGTVMRKYLENGDFPAFAKLLPAGADARAIYDILHGESTVREYVKAIWAGKLL